eukprot:CAMPEP_0202967076 /NCGR_PEP_ID=MMETSP1396-20130829/11820_1 /ASSEMBLY_ACC=CAM_ASM_000872 /TAXON_ID= /ORGANISM="Pseudokeronopsis sp., Strain Brazil" /LENGTH=63 /DNA_ID=CAMNT_0049691735 /DNA_START=1060 /DNA_END=1251 /DNA_ORIENTATION=+
MEEEDHYWPKGRPKHMEWFEEDELARVIKEFIGMDKDLESLKQMLSLKSDFNLEDCSKIFDLD